ncbi:alpha/beta-type small acid-soluble spore protein [Mechercharimyces sp. CAU 1602]|uniref:alpha/beta-type small acid-soluble spore protein n=1 Tax=Mechercharimyces sp. CAU 1602 TaxID=2973933 RepID=UPI002161D5CC|nr:alpha/beta-type small acid-soluble spore protein [Mechercharimyces sp. CAU 1602]MCS1350030.1 alpha/beta-type small acid-soluble spore protein [Mechercharimyces sp. CAU 1602]
MTRKRKRRSLLVPAAEAGMEQLKTEIMQKQLGRGHVSPEQMKLEIAKELHVPMQVGYNGELKAKQTGKVGGQIGGAMVKELVQRGLNQWRHQRN